MAMSNPRDDLFLKKLKDPELLSVTQARVSEEKKATLAVLYCLREIEQRRLHLARGFQSLFDFVTRELGYSPAAAQRRILAMRLLRDLPEVETKIEQGLMTLDTAARAQGFFKQEEKSAGKFSVEQKKEVLSQLEGKSSRQCERILASRSSQPETFLRPDSVKPVGESSVEVRFVAEEGLIKDLDRLRELLSNKNPSMTMAELIAEMAKIALAELDPECRDQTQLDPKRAERSLNPSVTPASASTPAPEFEPRKRTRYIPVRTRREVLKRDGYRCNYRDPLTGRRCESRFRLELDHCRVPFGKGGRNGPDNLQVVCSPHNMLRAIETYGAARMSRSYGRTS